MIDSSPIRHSSPMTAPSSIRAARMTSVFLPMTQPRRFVCGPMYTLSCTTALCRKEPDLTTTLEPTTECSRISAASFDLRVVADEQRPAQHRVRVDLGAFGDPHSGRDLEALQVDIDLALEYIGLRLDVALVRADVLPVALGDVAVDRLPFLHQLREDIAGPVDGDIGLDVVEDLRLHDVDAGVHRVREDLAPGRLLEEALDLPFLVDDGDAEFQGIGHPRQTDRDERTLFLVEIDELGQVEVGQCVT